MPLNNAYLMTVALYHRHFELFEVVLEKENGSIRKTILFIEKFFQKEGILIVQLRNVLNDPRF